MEGIDTKLECETVEENCHVLWFKDDEEIDSPARMTIERTQGCLHTLSLAPTSLEDSGTYSIKINEATSICKVYVKGNTFNKVHFSVTVLSTTFTDVLLNKM